jgi:hypothetical protein
MEAALLQLLSCVDSGRRDAASAALVRLQHACRAAAETGCAAAVEVPGERSLDRLLRHLSLAGGSARATKADFNTSLTANRALLILLNVRAVADAFLTEGRVAALVDTLEALDGGEEGGSGGREGISELRLWLLTANLAAAALHLGLQRNGPTGGDVDGGGGPINPAQLALAGVIARPAAVRVLVRAAHTQLSSELSAGDLLSPLEQAFLAAAFLRERATPAPHDTPSGPSSCAADLFAAARAAWQGADANWLCEALPPLLAMRLEEARQRQGTGPGGEALEPHAALFVALHLCAVVGPLSRALSLHAAAMRAVAACICRSGDIRLARSSLVILTGALDAWPWGHEGAGTALAACCQPDTLGELLRTAALRGTRGGSGVAAGTPANQEMFPTVTDGGCAAQLLASIAAHEALSTRPSSIAAVPATAAAAVASLRNWLEVDGAQMAYGNMPRLHQVCVMVLSVVAGGGADGDAWAATLLRLGARQLLMRAAAELGPRAPEWSAAASAALYAVTHAAHASHQQQQQQPAQGGTTSGLEEGEEEQGAVAALVDAGVYAVPQLLLLAALRPGWRSWLIQKPDILELLSAVAAAPDQGEYSHKALRTLCLLAAGAAPSERLPNFARAVLEVCNERPADVWAGVPELDSDGGAVEDVLGCLAGCHEAGSSVGERAALALTQLRIGKLGLVQPPSQQQQQQQEEEEQDVQQQQQQHQPRPQPQQHQQEDKPSMQQAPNTGHAGAMRTARPHSACAVCGRTAREGAKLRRCAGCGRVTGTRYCSQECCRTDWVVRGHRAVCEAARRGQEP